MVINPVLESLTKYDGFANLCEAVTGGQGAVAAFGVGAGKAPVIAALIQKAREKASQPALIVCPSEAAAAKLNEELKEYIPDTFHFPPRDMVLGSAALAASSGISARRLNVLVRLCAEEPVTIVTTGEALLQRLAPPKALIEHTIALKNGETRDLGKLTAELVGAGYERVAQCEGRGQFSVRGGIMDIFAITAENPYRIEFFDDEIDSIRTFDPDTQRSIDKVDAILIPPACEMPLLADARKRGLNALSRSPKGFEFELELLKDGGTPQGIARILPLFYPEEIYLSDYLAPDTLTVVDDPPRVEESTMVAFSNYLEAVSALLERGDGNKAQGSMYGSAKEAMMRLDGKKTLLLYALARQSGIIAAKELFKLDTRGIPQYNSATEALYDDVRVWRGKNYAVLLYAGSHAKRLTEELCANGAQASYAKSLSRAPINGEVLVVEAGLPKGFDFPDARLAVVTEAELFGLAHTVRKPRARDKQKLVFSELNVGDLIVHEAHGIGRFVRVEALTVEDKTKDYLLIEYAAGDRLYIPTDQLDRIQKYVGAGTDDVAPKLSKLGGGDWQKTVSRTREGVKALAFDLVKLYSERMNRKGHAFAKDNAWQRQMEERFEYEETPDQWTCIEEIKSDMENVRVMDRLLCGDVGYGKTEVALRAAFKAVMDGKQVAFLVPTTILAQQHYNTLASRYSGFPVNIELLSRFQTAAKQKEILLGMEQGHVDVVVGTHKLLSKNVKFKDLGLLVIDEEQRFGVGHKELIKDIKKSVDVLSLSATPIPRTLHMSMVGIRDMSVLETPPEQRFPVQTYVLEYSDALVREAVMKEIGRGGQVYIVYNNVRNMENYATALSALIPEARIGFAHGQMNERVLEKTMLEFMQGEYDVLLCSTIIESGMDIPNVNTIIVCDADHFGLSQLYQLRGRVGRSTRLGYAYLTFKRNKVLTEVAEKRLMSIREFTQFGAGFKIAVRDLEIRGAGNMLGPEQHGHMAEVGYDFYCKLMSQAVKQAKGEEVEEEIEASVEIPVDAFIPRKYIQSESQRLAIYKRIASIRDSGDMMDVQDELVDRYGDIPQSVQNLMDVAMLKAMAQRAFIVRLTVRDGEIKLMFHPEARIDGAKLFELCTQTGGAQLTHDENVTLVIKRNKATSEELLHNLPQFVYTILDCIATKKSV